MSWFFTYLLNAILLPPFNLLLIAMAALILNRSHPRLGRLLLVGSLTTLWLCTTPYFALGALHLLENDIKAVDLSKPPADAIVVLSGGTYLNAPEYGGIDTVGVQSLERLRYAAKLQRETGKPILITGGKPHDHDISEAQQMKAVLEKEFNVPVRWTEDAADNTLENARYSYQILQKIGIKRIYLVTHAWHMPRSIMAFQAVGFDVIPAPLAFTTHHQTRLFSLIPDADSLKESRIFMHELIGLLWYRLYS